jgi:hypothetical protein
MSEQPEHVYFTDADLGKRFPEILLAAGLKVERHCDLFPPAGKDEQWLEHCGKNGRVAVTHNERIRYTPNELAAVKEHQVRLLVVVGKVSHFDLAQNFVKTLPRIEAFMDQHKAPYIAKVYRPAPAVLAKDPQAGGTISLWHPK